MFAASVPHEEPHGEHAAIGPLVTRLRAIANPVRVRILQSLVLPTKPADLRIRAAGERLGFDADRMLGRSTIIEHLGILEEAGLVRRLGESYVLDQQGMVALLQDVGALARLRALVEVDVEVTRPAPAPVAAQALPPPPRLLVADGPEAGRALALAGAGPWRLGRGAQCELALAHDPHVSRVHATLSRDAGGFHLAVAPEAKNPVFVDFAPVAPGAAASVQGGALLAVGATALVLQG